MITLGLDIGSNSVGSAWIDGKTGSITTGVSIFPAGVDESDDKRGDPKNAKRRMVRRTRITLARRAARKRLLRLKLIEAGLLPASHAAFATLLEETDPWELRRLGLKVPLSPFHFGRVLLHLAQRRGALGLHVPDPDDEAEDDAARDDGRVTAAIKSVRAKMSEKSARTFGEFIARVRGERITAITTEDRRPQNNRNGPREWRAAVRNKAGSYEHCADRAMIRDEFTCLWERQSAFDGQTAKLLTPELRLALDNPAKDTVWRHQGLLFGQRATNWDLGTLGRCNLHPEERCVPHADMYASRYLVVETVNNLRIIECNKAARPLTPEEREKIKAYLSGPLGTLTETRKKDRKTGEIKVTPERPKRTVSVTDLRRKMAKWYGKDKWTHDKKRSPCRFRNEDSDEEKTINTDWFSREIIHGAVTPGKWAAMPQRVREGVNRAILKFSPEHEEDAEKLKTGAMDWAGLDEAQADALVVAWRTRPKPDAKRLSMGRRAVRNLLTVMDRPQPWPDDRSPTGCRWLTQIEARKLLAGDAEFVDVTTGKPLDETMRRRYATGAKGATARDRYYMGKHTLMKNGEPVIDRETGEPLAEPPPAPMVSNPVVRKAIHEVRRHLVEYMTEFACKPDHVYVELSREAQMGKKDADRLLFKNRLRNRIRTDIIRDGEFGLDAPHVTTTQQRAAIDRVILCVQQGNRCPLCGQGGLTTLKAARGEDCEVAHIIPRASGGHNGLSNIVLAHTNCNREMGRRTPREYWSDGPGFDQGMVWVEGVYGEVERPKFSEVKGGEPLWACYFTKRDDHAKSERFKMDVSDPGIQGMTDRQDAATKYAARQVMAYLADALYGGKGLPERSGGSDERKIFATDGIWTSRLRRAWGLFFDPHDRKSHVIDDKQRQERKEKDRGDHRHHAIDAVVIALCDRRLQIAWEERERLADIAGINTADEEAMDSYRRSFPLKPPPPYKAREDFRAAVGRAVFGNPGSVRPICHRPVKRKIVGHLHKATQQGPALDVWHRDDVTYKERVKERTTVRQNVLGETKSDFLKPSHLRLPRHETDQEAIDRIARRLRIGKAALSHDDAVKQAKKVVKSPGFMQKQVDPKPDKGGIVRDIGLRRRIRKDLEKRGLDPDNYVRADLKRSIDQHGPLTMESGVPIHRVVLLWSNTDPVEIQRIGYDYATGEKGKETSLETVRLYDSQNNHHIEIRKNGKGKWTGSVVTTYETAQHKLAKLRAFREAGVPKPKYFRDLKRDEYARWQRERAQWRPAIAKIEAAHPLVDRADDDVKGGRFVMSLCEGETVYMKHKRTGEVDYFVVAEIMKAKRVVMVPHWDARAAGERRDSEGRTVPNSKRDEFEATPSDLKNLAPPGHPHAMKVRVSPLGAVTVLDRD